MVGRTNSPAFAMRFHTHNDLHGETLNPHAREVSCGGSSGGAGVAVATGMCHVAQGNDVAGSVRWPATLNGVIGLRPTIGRMPTGGTNPAVPRGWSAVNMSTQGPLARTMRDLRATYHAMATGDWNEPFWVPAPHHFPGIETPKRVALVLNDGQELDPHVVDAVKRVGDALANAGYDVTEAVPPMTESFFTLWERLGTFDIALGLAPMLPGINDSGLTASISDWVDSIPPPTPQTFMAALADRDLVMRVWNSFLADHPLLITPMMAKSSIPRGYDVAHKGAMEELLRHGRWGVNLSAIAMPALAFPTGHVSGVPIGVQMVAHQWREDILLDAGDVLERHFGRVAPVDVAWAP
jgi:amidase